MSKVDDALEWADQVADNAPGETHEAILAAEVRRLRAMLSDELARQKKGLRISEEQGSKSDYALTYLHEGRARVLEEGSVLSMTQKSLQDVQDLADHIIDQVYISDNELRWHGPTIVNFIIAHDAHLLDEAAERIKKAIRAEQNKHEEAMLGKWHTKEYSDGLRAGADIACAAVRGEVEK